ncbi:MAG: RDD family protein [Pseudobdellovibrio sp.]
MNYAGFWRRYAALFIDGLIMWIPSIVLDYFFKYPVASIFINIFYKPIFESSSLKGTPGKAVMGIVVVNEFGGQLTLAQAYTRYACSFLSGFVLMLGYFMSLFTAKRQTLHDIVAGTVVIEDHVPDINYFEAWKQNIVKLYYKLSGNNTDSSFKYNSGSNSSVSSVHQERSHITDHTDRTLKAIEDLHKLYQAGAITHEEYELKKQELLKKI